MRPKRKDYTLAALNATGYASNATGAAWTLSSTAGPSDGLAHQVTIKNDAATDHSAKTAVITGTSAEGHAQTETLNLPGNAATVTSVGYFRTVTSVVPSATIGADTMDIGWNAVGVTPAYVCNAHSGSGPQIGVKLGGTVSIGLEQTNDDPFVAPIYWKSVDISAENVDYLSGVKALRMAMAPGTTAVRVLVNSHTAGTLAITYSQGT
jgi:hypothetical protein